MRLSRLRTTACVGALVAFLTTSAAAQEILPAPGSPAPLTVSTEGQDEALRELIRGAVQARLRVEREQVAGEVRRGLLYDEEDIDAALALLSEAGAGTQSDNLDRICRALAKVDLRFGRAFEHFQAGRFEDAARDAEPPPGVQEFTYLTAARLYLRAEALARGGDDAKALESWESLLQTMPDRVSFAAEAAIRTGETYEKMGRLQYATEMYQRCVTDYGLSIGEDRLEQLRGKIEEYRAVYRDPLNAIAEKMGLVQQRLVAGDSSQSTRDDQDWIVAVLEDLIKTAEEQQSGGQSDPSKRQRQQKQQGQTANRPKPQAGGRASAGRQPSSPARGPGSPAGEAPLIPGSTSVRPTDDSGDWAKLPPRERERIERIRRKLIPQRYRSAISDYHTRMAEEGGRE
jgi:tetratricopeptide (TPR) repeat protein